MDERKCLHCGKAIVDNGRVCDQGYETRNGQWIHHGCSLLVDGERPMPKGSLVELLKQAQNHQR